MITGIVDYRYRRYIIYYNVPVLAAFPVDMFRSLGSPRFPGREVLRGGGRQVVRVEDTKLLLNTKSSLFKQLAKQVRNIQNSW